VLGFTAGVILALFLGRAIRALLFGAQLTNLLTIVGVIVVLLVVGTVACFIPLAGRPVQMPWQHSDSIAHVDFLMTLTYPGGRPTIDKPRARAALYV
jgi:hypothetical protein